MRWRGAAGVRQAGWWGASTPPSAAASAAPGVQLCRWSDCRLCCWRRQPFVVQQLAQGMEHRQVGVPSQALPPSGGGRRLAGCGGCRCWNTLLGARPLLGWWLRWLHDQSEACSGPGRVVGSRGQMGRRQACSQACRRAPPPPSAPSPVERPAARGRQGCHLQLPPACGTKPHLQRLNGVAQVARR